MGQLVSFNGQRFIDYPPIYEDPLAHIDGELETINGHSPMAATVINTNAIDSRPRPETSVPIHNVDGFKLSVSDLNKSPEDVFDIVAKVGEGSYGSVHKAIHRETKQTLAVKKVPVDTDLQEIIKEITIMQQCDSPYIVKYFGSYFKSSDLWIIMELCDAGSVSDLMRLRRTTLNEAEASSILRDTLKGLNYLHGSRKIHRDIKAGNILLNMDGNAKLADFGVAGQLTDTIAKRNTIIGTPFWMSPEVIQEIGYNTKADIWSFGILCIEMAEDLTLSVLCRPPHAEIHPMRAIFLIPTKPPPTLKNPDDWSASFNDLIAKCLVKNPEERTNAEELLKHDFIVNSSGPDVVRSMIEDAQDVAAHYLLQESQNHNGTYTSGSPSTLIRHDTGGNTLISNTSYNNTGIDFGDSTLIQHRTLADTDNNKLNEESNYESFNRAFANQLDLDGQNNAMHRPTKSSTMPPPPSYENAQQQIQRQQEQIAQNQRAAKQSTDSTSWGSNTIDNQFRKAMNEPMPDFRFLNDLSTEQLLEKKQLLDKEMDAELEALQARYHAKRQAILEAMNRKKEPEQRF
ncbi:Non-specific serine/threonine protein kinase [Aphelenchoides bicaudatus]|nr:Non-specific serine/threonine protein kinase [Aphelenchoides bicaudatus]